MKKILTALVAFGLVIAPMNSFGQSLSPTKRNNQTVSVIAVVLAATTIMALIISSSNDDKPTSP